MSEQTQSPLVKHAPRINALRSHLYVSRDDLMAIELYDYAATLEAERDDALQLAAFVAEAHSDSQTRHCAEEAEWGRTLREARERIAKLEAELVSTRSHLSLAKGMNDILNQSLSDAVDERDELLAAATEYMEWMHSRGIFGPRSDKLRAAIARVRGGSDA